LGGFDKLMETLRKRLEEQKGRHQGGSKWIGTAGTSPFGAYGYNPEGVRIGQSESRHQRAVKVWDRRDFKNLDDRVELGTRNIKVALRRLRRWARDGADQELDLDATIRATADHGWLDVQTRPERRNAVKVILFLDVGGSMDPYIKVMEELFSAARSEFKHFAPFYFHNCLYEGVWRDNRRRWDDQTRRWTCSTPTAPTGTASSWATPPCRPTKSPIPAAPTNIGTARRAGLAGTRLRPLVPPSLDQPGARTAVALYPIHPADPRHLRRPHGADDAGRHHAGVEGNPMIRRIWQRNPLLSAAFLLAVASCLFFTWRAVDMALILTNRAEKPVAGWMTPRYIAWQLRAGS
jgi:hypothetical protein